MLPNLDEILPNFVKTTKFNGNYTKFRKNY